MTPEQRITTYLTLPSVLQERYSSDATSDLNQAMADKYQLDNDQFHKYMDVVGDTILGAHKITELPQLLQSEVGLTAEIATQIANDLQDFLQPVKDREAGKLPPDEPAVEDEAETEAEINDETTTVPAAPMAEAGAPTDEAEPTETTPSEVDLHAVQPMRTMGDDVSRVHGYGAYRTLFPEVPGTETVTASSQDDLLNRPKPKLTDTPTYQEPASPEPPTA